MTESEALVRIINLHPFLSSTDITPVRIMSIVYGIKTDALLIFAIVLLFS